MVDPVWEYTHSGGQHNGCSISGGYVVRDQEVPDLLGRYLYSDYCNGAIYSNVLALPDAIGDVDTGLIVNFPSTFGEDSCGHVYVAGRGAAPTSSASGSRTRRGSSASRGTTCRC